MCPTQSDKSMDQSHHRAEKKKTQFEQNWHSIKAIQTATKTNKKTHHYMYFKTHEQLNVEPTIQFVGGMMTLWLVFLTLEQAIQV